MAVVASSSRLARNLIERVGRPGMTNRGASAINLGIDFAPGRPRTAHRHSGRRAHRFHALARKIRPFKRICKVLGGKASKIFVAGPLPFAVYGSIVNGLTDAEALKLRRVLALSWSPRARGRSLRMLTLLHRAPTHTAENGPALQYAREVWRASLLGAARPSKGEFTLSEIDVLWRSISREGVLPTAAGKRNWNASRGPIATLWLTLDRIGWSMAGPFTMIDDFGREVALTTHSPAMIAQMMHLATLRVLERQLGEKMAADGFSCFGGRRVCLDHVRARLQCDRKMDAAAKAVYGSALCGAVMTRSRAARGGYLIEDKCPLCGLHSDTVFNRTWICTHRDAVDARNHVAPRWLQQEAVRRGAGDPLYALGLFPNPADDWPKPIDEGKLHLYRGTQSFAHFVDAAGNEDYQKMVKEIENWQPDDGDLITRFKAAAIGDDDLGPRVNGKPDIMLAGRLYVDGSSTQHTFAELRRAAAALVVRQPYSDIEAWYLLPVWAPLPQTSQSAEYLAAIAPQQNIVSNATVVSDCRNVVVDCAREGRGALSAKKKYAGLFKHAALAEARKVTTVVKTKAHRCVSALPAGDDREDAVGNAAADRAAKQAVKLHPQPTPAQVQDLDAACKRATMVIRTIAAVLSIFPPMPRERMLRRPANVEGANFRGEGDHEWHFIHGLWRCSKCLCCTVAQTLTPRLVHSQCTGIRPAMMLPAIADKGHDVAYTAGRFPIVFCCRCGAFSWRRSYGLARPCPRRPTPAGRQALVRLRKGLVPWIGARESHLPRRRIDAAGGGVWCPTTRRARGFSSSHTDDANVANGSHGGHPLFVVPVAFDHPRQREDLAGPPPEESITCVNTHDDDEPEHDVFGHGFGLDDNGLEVDAAGVPLIKRRRVDTAGAHGDAHDAHDEGQTDCDADAGLPLRGDMDATAPRDNGAVTTHVHSCRTVGANPVDVDMNGNAMAIGAELPMEDSSDRRAGRDGRLGETDCEMAGANAVARGADAARDAAQGHEGGVLHRGDAFPGQHGDLVDELADYDVFGHGGSLNEIEDTRNTGVHWDARRGKSAADTSADGPTDGHRDDGDVQGSCRVEAADTRANMASVVVARVGPGGAPYVCSTVAAVPPSSGAAATVATYGAVAELPFDDKARSDAECGEATASAASVALCSGAAAACPPDGCAAPSDDSRPVTSRPRGRECATSQMESSLANGGRPCKRRRLTPSQTAPLRLGARPSKCGRSILTEEGQPTPGAVRRRDGNDAPAVPAEVARCSDVATWRHDWEQPQGGWARHGEDAQDSECQRTHDGGGMEKVVIAECPGQELVARSDGQRRGVTFYGGASSSWQSPPTADTTSGREANGAGREAHGAWPAEAIGSTEMRQDCNGDSCIPGPRAHESAARHHCRADDAAAATAARTATAAAADVAASRLVDAPTKYERQEHGGAEEEACRRGGRTQKIQRLREAPRLHRGRDWPDHGRGLRGSHRHGGPPASDGARRACESHHQEDHAGDRHRGSITPHADRHGSAECPRGERDRVGLPSYTVCAVERSVDDSSLNRPPAIASITSGPEGGDGNPLPAVASSLTPPAHRQRRGARRTRARDDGPGGGGPLGTDGHDQLDGWIMPWMRTPAWMYLPHLDDAANSANGGEAGEPCGPPLASGAPQEPPRGSPSTDLRSTLPGPRDQLAERGQIRGRRMEPGRASAVGSRTAEIRGPEGGLGSRGADARARAQVRLDDRNWRLRRSLDDHEERVRKRKELQCQTQSGLSPSERMAALRRRVASRGGHMRAGGEDGTLPHGAAADGSQHGRSDERGEVGDAGFCTPAAGGRTGVDPPSGSNEDRKIHQLQVQGGRDRIRDTACLDRGLPGACTGEDAAVTHIETSVGHVATRDDIERRGIGAQQSGDVIAAASEVAWHACALTEQP